MIFFDYDGVLQDTWQEINRQKEETTEKSIFDFYYNLDWDSILRKSPWIQQNIALLKKLNKETDVAILTSITSLNEGVCKAKYIKKHIGNLIVILVPFGMKKTQLVNSRNNILIDDNLKNIENWRQHGGMGILYSMIQQTDIEQELLKIGLDIK